MQATTEKTVRDIVIENPSAARVFEDLGIDYCCGGKRSLTDACATANVELPYVLDLLGKAGQGGEAPQGEPSLSELITHVVQNHHAFVRREIPRLSTLLLKVAGKHGVAHPEVAEIEPLFAAIGQELSTHMFKEEHVLFPYIEQMEHSVLAGRGVPPAFFGTVQRPIANMVAEHDDAGALLSRIRELSHRYTPPEGVCPSFLALYKGLEEFERDLHQHIHLENNILFPRAIEMEAA